MDTVLLDHARTALDYAGESLADLHAALPRAGAGLGYQHRRLIDDALRDLRQREETLQRLYGAMCTAAREDQPARWQEFFAAYDAYLATMRDVRSRLLQDDEDDAG